MTSIEVTIVSTLKGYQCRTTIQTHTNQTVESVIKECCRANGWTRRQDFALVDQNQEILHKKDQLELYSVQAGDELFLIIHDSEQWCCNCSQWWLLSVICFLVALTGLVAICLMLLKTTPDSYKYAVGLDAGSSHTQLYVYKWLAYKSNGTGIVTETFSCKSGHAISSFTTDPSQAGLSLMECLNKSRDQLTNTKNVEISNVPILLGATAGMRILELKNKTLADDIMDSVHSTIRPYPFNSSHMDSQVRVISGTEEAAYAWISTNFFNGSFGFRVMSTIDPSKPLGSDLSSDWPTLGALDLGGASTQISFQPERRLSNSSDDGYIDLKLYGYQYDIYTHSFLCYGINQALLRYQALLISKSGNTTDIEDPCAPSGNRTRHNHSEICSSPCTAKYSACSNSNSQEDVEYTFHGTSNSTQCRSLTLELFNFTTCDTPPCSFNGVHQPPVHGQFMAFSGFYYTMKFLNLTDGGETRSLDDFIREKNSYCSLTWDEVKNKTLNPGETVDTLVTSCFKANFIHALLVDGYHFNESTWTNIHFQDKIYGASLGWIIGMMVNSTNVVPALDPPSPRISVAMFSVLLVFFILFLILSVGFACYARVVSRRERGRGYRELTSEATPTGGSYGSLEERDPLPV